MGFLCAPPDKVTPELLMSKVIQLEAIINLLDKKGIISKQELQEEMIKVQSKMIKSEK